MEHGHEPPRRKRMTGKELRSLRLAEETSASKSGVDHVTELHYVAAEVRHVVQEIYEADDLAQVARRYTEKGHDIRSPPLSPRHAAALADAQAKAEAEAAEARAADVVQDVPLGPARNHDGTDVDPRQLLPMPEDYGIELLADVEARLDAKEASSVEPSWAGGGPAGWIQSSLALESRLDNLPSVPPSAAYKRKAQLYAQRRTILQAALQTSITASDQIAVAVRALEIELETKSRANADLHDEMLELRDKLKAQRRKEYSRKAHGALQDLTQNLRVSEALGADDDVADHEGMGGEEMRRTTTTTTTRRRRRRKKRVGGQHQHQQDRHHAHHRGSGPYLQRGGGAASTVVLPPLDLEIAALEHEIYASDALLGTLAP